MQSKCHRQQRRLPVIVVFITLCFIGCQRSTSSSQSITQDQPRQITLKSHLGGTLDKEPVVNIGELVIVVPDPAEPYTTHNRVTVQLPATTPYRDNESLYYLYGYAVGQSSYENGHVACHTNTTEARQHKSWNDGWAAGFEARKSQEKSNSEVPG